MKLNVLIVALTRSLTSGCAHYNDRTTDTNKNGRTACDTEPKNQAGCYTKQSKGWNWGGLKFGVGASDKAWSPTDAMNLGDVSDRSWRLSGRKMSG